MNPNQLTVAACDLDDTLLGRDGAVSARNEAAIVRWLEAGRRFVIATGRPPRTVGEHLPAVLQQAPWICYNGAEIYEQGRLTFSAHMPPGALEMLLDRILTDFPDFPDSTVGFEQEDLLWLNKARPQPNRYAHFQRVVDLKTRTGLASAKMLVFDDDLDALVAACEPPPPGVRLMLSGRYPFLQLMSTEADKVHALRHLLAQWGQTLENVVAFGDDINDVDMLRSAALGVAVANAWPPVLQVADHISAANVDDGVALVLERLLDG